MAIQKPVLGTLGEGSGPDVPVGASLVFQWNSCETKTTNEKENMNNRVHSVFHATCIYTVYMGHPVSTYMNTKKNMFFRCLENWLWILVLRFFESFAFRTIMVSHCVSFGASWLVRWHQFKGSRTQEMCGTTGSFCNLFMMDSWFADGHVWHLKGLSRYVHACQIEQKSTMCKTSVVWALGDNLFFIAKK